MEIVEININNKLVLGFKFKYIEWKFGCKVECLDKAKGFEVLRQNSKNVNSMFRQIDKNSPYQVNLA
jgi:hypothetical protein